MSALRSWILCGVTALGALPGCGNGGTAPDGNNTPNPDLAASTRRDFASVTTDDAAGQVADGTVFADLTAVTTDDALVATADAATGDGAIPPDFALPVDFTIIPDFTMLGDMVCVGVGCLCQDDTVCSAGGVQAICVGGTCKVGCDPTVPCANGQKCCNNQCVMGVCCASADCPMGQICNANNMCGACTQSSDCGKGGLCCAPMAGAKTCVMGTCCADADCTGGQSCVNYQCRDVCGAKNGCANGQKCCGTSCFPGNCCANNDCTGGQACVNNSCQACSGDAQCGAGQICNSGKCAAGCDPAVQCGGTGVCCSGKMQCGPNGKNCTGMCVTGNCCANADCPGGQVCASDSTCRKACAAPSDCANGQHCCSGYCYATSCVSTLAGSGLDTAPDSAANKAVFNGIYGSAVDDNGSVFFTEVRGSGLRVLNNGTANIGPVGPANVGRLAGGIYGCKPGPALLAEMQTPWGVARDGSGNVYVSDYSCAVIWKLSADYANVTVLAGQPGNHGVSDGVGGAATLGNPSGLAFGVDGKLYLAEWGWERIRQIGLDGTVKTVAGSGTYGESDGPALQATFKTPGGIAMDSAANVFIVDWDTGAIRRLSNPNLGNPMVTTVVPSQGRNGTQGSIAVGSGNNVFTAQWNSGVYSFKPPGPTYAGTNISGGGSMGVSLDPSGDALYVTGWVDDAGPNAGRIVKTDLNGNPQTSWGVRNMISVADGGPGTADFQIAECSGAIAVDSNANVWVADRCAQRVRRIAPTGTVTSIGSGQTGESGGNATTAQFCYPTAITTNGTDVYVTNNYCGRHINKIDANGNVTLLSSICVAGDGCAYPTPPGGMAVDKAGNLYVTTYQADGVPSPPGMPTIVKVPSYGTGTPSYFAGTRRSTGCADGAPGTGQFGTWPYGLAIDAGGFLYVGDGQCGLRQVAPDGTIITLNKEFGVIGVAVGPVKAGKQALYTNSGDGWQIWQVDPVTGKNTKLTGINPTYAAHYLDGPLSSAIFWGVHGLAVDPSGSIDVLDISNSRIRVIYP